MRLAGQTNGSNDDALIFYLDGVEMNRTVWGPSNTAAGVAWSLSPSHYKGSDNNTRANWCNTPNTSIFDIDGVRSGTNYGTPGKINPACPSTEPGVALVVPLNGLAAGGELVAVFGSGFVSGKTRIAMGGTDCGSLQFVSANIVTCVTGARASGPVSVTANVGDAPGVTSQALLNGYTYTVAGDGPFTSATLVGAGPYTVPAASIGPLITLSVAPGGVANARAELGYGPAASDPSATPNWAWIPAIRATTGATDTFTRALTINTAGTFAYGYRVSADGVTWRYTTTRTATTTP